MLLGNWFPTSRTNVSPSSAKHCGLQTFLPSHCQQPLTQQCSASPQMIISSVTPVWKPHVPTRTMQDGGEARIWTGIQKVPGHSRMPLKGHDQFVQIPLAFVNQKPSHQPWQCHKIQQVQIF